MRVFLKNMHKSWFSGIATPLAVTIFVPLITAIWPEFKTQASSFMELLKNPIYKAMLGDLINADIGTWQGFFYMYIFMWMQLVLLFVTIFVPARLITNEVDKRTLDITLSYPIPRWRYLLEKFCVYLAYNLLYPALIYSATYLSTNALGETIDYTILNYSLIGVWFLFFALGAISLLCGAVFLEGSRALAASGALIIGQYILVRFADVVESLNYLKKYTLFNYLDPAAILDLGRLPMDELLVVAGVGVVALLAALYVFQKRELAI
ncbi:ABC transporter permease [Candidatus Bathyarchaeota archaeon]|nr:MAG: ABC transporter permease [Candidatus Bathyarchaeota archaeon]